MFSILKNKKENYLLFIGIGIFSCALLFRIIVVYYFQNIDLKNSRNDFFESTNNFFQIMIYAIIIAPVLEEFAFRGIFSESKKIRFTYFFLSPVIILISKNYYLLFLYVIVLFLYFYQKNKYLVYFTISVIFALIHYKFIDFQQPIKSVSLLFQFSISLMLIWIIINYNIFKAVFFHAVINALMLLPIAYSLQFPNKEVHSKKVQQYKFVWQKVPYLDNKSIQIFKDKNQTNINNITLYKLMEMYEMNSNNYKIVPEYGLYKLNFQIINYGKEEKLDSTKIEKLLIESKLIKYK